MNRYSVCVPITGRIFVEVDAEDEKGAIDAAIDAACDAGRIDEWETHKRVVSGNCFHGMQNEVEVELLEAGVPNEGGGSDG